MSNPAEVPAIEVRNLTRGFAGGGGKRRGRGQRWSLALDDVSLVIGQGEVHGVLGPNGAGKTTLCKILSTVLLPTSGVARVLGHDVVTETDQVRRLVGIVFGGERGLYGRLTARQNVEYWGALYGLRGTALTRGAQEVVERVGLADRSDERVERLSRGLIQRVHLARGLVSDPQVLLLDEPTAGMDAVAAQGFRALIRDLRAEKRTVLLTTHDMSEAEELCDRVSFVGSGTVLATEPPAVLGEWITKFERVDVEDLPPAQCAALSRQSGVGDVTRLDDGRTRFETTETGAAARLVGELASRGFTRICTSRPSLEEVYLRLFGSAGEGLRR